MSPCLETTAHLPCAGTGESETQCRTRVALLATLLRLASPRLAETSDDWESGKFTSTCKAKTRPQFELAKFAAKAITRPVPLCVIRIQNSIKTHDYIDFIALLSFSGSNRSFRFQSPRIRCLRASGTLLN